MTKKRFLSAFLMLFVTFSAFADGIEFKKYSWDEALKNAKKEKKLIFIDFYTQWCGPCLNMAKEVFTKYPVADYYNANFINLKLDAEQEEWKELAKEYGVFSYPTYVYVDPKTEQVVHRSSSRQTPELFIYTGESAYEKERRSTYLIEQYKAGNKKPQLLIDYATYMSSVYNRDAANEAIETLLKDPKYNILNEQVWDFFCQFVTARNTQLYTQFLENYEALKGKYGKEIVEKKMGDLCQYVPNMNEFDQMPEFESKKFQILKNRANAEIRKSNYSEAIKLIDEVMTYQQYNAEICEFLRFTARSATYKQVSPEWAKACLSYAQYVAYNDPNRDNAMSHYEYANMLEKLLKSLPQANEVLPQSISEQPKVGKSEYSTRPDELKAKPRYRKKK